MRDCCIQWWRYCVIALVSVQVQALTHMEVKTSWSTENNSSQAVVFWFYGPDGQFARGEIEQLYTELVLAEIHPHFLSRWQEYAQATAAIDKATVLEAMLADLMIFKRQWQAISNEQRMRLRFDFDAITDFESHQTFIRAAREQGNLYALALSLRPQHPHYKNLREAVSRFVILDTQESWPVLSDTVYEQGMQHPEVATLKWMLFQLGDLDLESTDNVFDEVLTGAVQSFQTRHGLPATGKLDAKTAKWLELLPRERARVVARNILRQSHLQLADAQSYVLVNIPEFRLRFFTDSQESWTGRVIVGRLSRPTPVMFTQIENIVMNPPWYVPRRIAWNDLLPKILKDPEFLERQGFQVLDKEGKEVNLNSKRKVKRAVKEGFPYLLKQRPGEKNALGRYKFFAPNNRSVFVHDTPAVNLFEKQRRTFSSGCIRLEDAQGFAEFLLQYDKRHTNVSHATTQTTELTLATPVPLYLVYWTSWVDANHRLQFREDIYGRDRKPKAKLAKPALVLQSDDAITP